MANAYGAQTQMVEALHEPVRAGPYANLTLVERRMERQRICGAGIVFWLRMQSQRCERERAGESDARQCGKWKFHR